ncbi:hypothetical protein K5X77_01965 [Vagococcus lutrae]|uniref:Uncharacterized protein n=2 Tax=Vagococcus lutrae TaxID=81947 RepID=V6Q4B4_9ENTE|nr:MULTISPECIES: hypothetical protein [Vagococcus]EST89979.1 hypothetical protein T233_00876 [Vagococcus lutrae LBD1]MCO7150595.1 hypothetical protein [Vagococcus lutrae]MDT2800916.1 hypothetical protein [Vagococcus lutrae]MDT2805173.1 hypothetical protein [Vagococcus lutrae]MDT2808231.1 hypothetical protein [Vagococcus lutrae]
MTKQMTALKFFFRNGETWTIKRENIGDLWIKQISTSFGRINGSDFQKINPCEALRIEILEEADHVQTDDINLGGLEMGMFARALKYEDIEKMAIVFDNGTEDLIYFPYEDKMTEGQEGLDNKHQTTKIGKNKNLYIVIDPKETVETLYQDK